MEEGGGEKDRSGRDRRETPVVVVRRARAHRRGDTRRIVGGSSSDAHVNDTSVADNGEDNDSKRCKEGREYWGGGNCIRSEPRIGRRTNGSTGCDRKAGTQSWQSCGRVSEGGIYG